eukprot:2468003-Amphidinium_carterae.1
MASKTPWSSKIQCTLQAQVPELFERISSLVETIKKEGVKESQSAAVSSNTQSPSVSQTTLNVTVGDEEEIILKILKKAKHD